MNTPILRLHQRICTASFWWCFFLFTTALLALTLSQASLLFAIAPDKMAVSNSMESINLRRLFIVVFAAPIVESLLQATLLNVAKTRLAFAATAVITSGALGYVHWLAAGISGALVTGHFILLCLAFRTEASRNGFRRGLLLMIMVHAAHNAALATLGSID